MGQSEKQDLYKDENGNYYIYVQSFGGSGWGAFLYPIEEPDENTDLSSYNNILKQKNYYERELNCTRYPEHGFDDRAIITAYFEPNSF